MARQQTERLGARIRERRLELGLGQRDVADRMTGFPKVSDQYVSKWERAQNRPDDDHIEALAEALETTVGDLWAGPVAERESGGETPDLMASFNGDAPADADDLRAQLDRIERKVDALLDAQENVDLDEVLDEINAADAAERGEQRSTGAGTRAATDS